MRAFAPTLSADRQATTTFDGNAGLVKLATVADAIRSIGEIKDQGEGAATVGGGSPYTPNFGAGHELAHFEEFDEPIEEPR